MNKPTIVAVGMMATLFAAVGIGSTPQAFAQYFGGGGTASPEQIEECKTLGIEENQCSDTTILAKKRLINAQNNPSTGSGTPMLSTETGQMAIFIGVLGAIFGGVAAAFFFKGRGAKPVST